MSFPFSPDALLSAGTGLLGGLFNIGATKSAGKNQMKLAQYQYDKAVEMWNRQNEYNAPKAQMARLSEAGLNPNLVYGSGNVAGNTSAQAPTYNPPDMSHFIPDYRGAFQATFDNMQRMATIKNLDSQNDNLAKQNQVLESQIALNEANRHAIDAKTQGQLLMNKQIPEETKRLLLQNLYQSLQNTEKGIALDYFEDFQKANLDKLKKENQQINQQTLLSAAQTLETEARKRNINANTQRTIMETGLIPLHQQLLTQNIALNENALRKFDAEFLKLATEIQQNRANTDYTAAKTRQARIETMVRGLGLDETHRNPIIQWINRFFNFTTRKSLPNTFPETNYDVKP